MSISDSCTVRRLQQADVHAMLEILRSVREEYGMGQRLAAVLEPADYAMFEAYRKRRCAYFVAIEDGRIVGGAGIAPLRGGDWLTCELQRMYVRNELRGRGVGQKLLDACVSAAQALGFARCYAETIAQMEGALAFYDRNGFIRLDGPSGSTGHGFNNRWLMLHFAAPVSGGHC